MLALAEWPQMEGYENPAAEAEIGFIVDLISEIRSVRAEMNVPAAAQIPLVLVNASPDVKSRAEAWDETLKRLARLSDISFAADPPEKSVQMIVRKTLAALPLQGIVDIAAEKARLAKEIAKLTGEAGKIEAKLNNADFVSRAPEEVIEENRERLSEALSRVEKLEAARDPAGRSLAPAFLHPAMASKTSLAFKAMIATAMTAAMAVVARGAFSRAHPLA